MRTPLVQQGLVNGDPDVDAIFRLTRKQITSPLDIQFDDAAPPLILPESVFAPFNSQNTVFHYKALWAMVLPISVEFRVTDILRGYWAQPLLWAIGTRLGFYSPHTIQRRNPHLYLRDFGEEDQLYKQAGTLVNFLNEWNCSKSNLYDCMVELTISMAEKNLWSFKEIEHMEAWIFDLKSIGYQSPVLQTRNCTCLDRKLQSTAIFNGVKIKDGWKPPNHRIPLREICNISLSVGISQNSLQPIEDRSILLVVTFNWPHYENIWLLDSIYRPHYPNIVYCGDFYNSSTHDTLLASERFTSANIGRYSFVRATVREGYFAYECALRVIDMNYGVKGYLVLSDDILLNFWNNLVFKADQVWSPRSHTSYVRSPSHRWRPWHTRYGVNATRLAMTQIYHSSADLFVQFRTQREANGFNESTLLGGYSDIFYLPKMKQEMFYEVGSVMRENEVFLEIAVIMLMSGISSNQNTYFVPGAYLPYSTRRNPLKFFNASIPFLHAVKPGYVISKKKLRVQYCRLYVTRVLEFGRKRRTNRPKRSKRKEINCMGDSTNNCKDI